VSPYGRGDGEGRRRDCGPGDRPAAPSPALPGELIRAEERAHYSVRLRRGEAGYLLTSHLKCGSMDPDMCAVRYRYRTFEGARAGFDFVVACNELFWAMLRHQPHGPILAELDRLERIADETCARLDDSPTLGPRGSEHRGQAGTGLGAPG